MRQVFHVSKIGTVAGCYVLTGIVQRNALVRVKRDDEVIFKGAITSLKRFKDDVKEVQAGFECGIAIEGFDELEEGDILEVYVEEEKAKAIG